MIKKCSQSRNREHGNLVPGKIMNDIHKPIQLNDVTKQQIQHFPELHGIALEEHDCERNNMLASI